jgi:undecaprenyl-diphosphatase
VLTRFEPTRPTGLGLTAAVTVAVAATWIFLGISQDVVAHEEIALLDPRVHAWMLAHRAGALTAFFRGVTWLGASVVTLPALAAAAIFLVLRRRSWVPVLDIAVVYGAAVILHAVVAQLVHRPRPPAADWLSPARGWSFPSGHTTQAVAAWGILALLLTVGVGARTRVLIAGAAGTVAVLVGVSRVYLGVHWLTDVLAAAAMSVAMLALWAIAHRTLAPTVPPAGATAAQPDRPGDERSSPAR